MAGSRRHHYIPQFYLKRFSRDGKIWVFDIQEDQFRRQGSKNIAVKKDYYSPRNEYGEPDPIIEDEFLNRLDGMASKVVKKVVEKETLSIDDRITLSFFISYMITRVPAFEKMVNYNMENLGKAILSVMFADIEQGARILENYEKEQGEKLNTSAEKMRDFLYRDKYSINFNRETSLGPMLSVPDRIWKSFMMMDWYFLHAPRKASFITTDNPFIRVPPNKEVAQSPYGYGIWTKGVLKIIPLDKKVCLVVEERGDVQSHVDGDREMIKLFNNEIAVKATRYIFARDEALLKAVKRRVVAA